MARLIHFLVGLLLFSLSLGLTSNTTIKDLQIICVKNNVVISRVIPWGQGFSVDSSIYLDDGQWDVGLYARNLNQIALYSSSQNIIVSNGLPITLNVALLSRMSPTHIGVSGMRNTVVTVQLLAVSSGLDIKKQKMIVHGNTLSLGTRLIGSQWNMAAVGFNAAGIPIQIASTATPILPRQDNTLEMILQGFSHAPSLLAYYPLNRDFRDYSGNGFHLIPRHNDQPFSGQYYGPLSSKPGVLYGATLGQIPSDITNGFTVSGFMQKSSGTHYDGVAFGFGHNEYATPRMNIGFSNGLLQTSVHDYLNDQYLPIHDGKWHHIALVVPPASSPSANTYSVYLDGEMIFSALAKRFSDYGDFFLGTFNGTGDVDGLMLDEVKIFNRALSPEALALEATFHADNLPTPLQPELLATYPLNGSFMDESGNGLHLMPYQSNQLFTNDYLGPIATTKIPYGGVLDIPSLSMAVAYSAIANIMIPSQSQGVIPLLGFKNPASPTDRLLISAQNGQLVVDRGTSLLPLGADVNDNTWHQLGIIVQRQNGLDSTTFYLDGIPEYSESDASLNITQFEVGSLTGADSAGFSIDEIQLYSTALSVADLIKHTDIHPLPPTTGDIKINFSPLGQNIKQVRLSLERRNANGTPIEKKILVLTPTSSQLDFSTSLIIGSWNISALASDASGVTLQVGQIDCRIDRQEQSNAYLPLESTIIFQTIQVCDISPRVKSLDMTAKSDSGDEFSYHSLNPSTSLKVELQLTNKIWTVDFLGVDEYGIQVQTATAIMDKTSNLLELNQHATLNLSSWILEPDLLAYYPLDDNFHDYSGHGYHLQPQSTNQPFIGNAFGPLPAVSSSYGATLASIPSGVTTGFTLMGFMLKSGGNNYSGTAFGFGDTGYLHPRATIEFPSGILSSGVGDRTKESYIRIHNGYWHHIALVVPPAVYGEVSYDVYVDGVAAYKGAIKRLSSYGTFSLGTFVSPITSDLASIRLDDVRLYQRALSPQEINYFVSLHPTQNTISTTDGGASVSLPSTRRIIPPTPVTLNGRLVLHPITNEWICVVGDYNDFIRNQLQAECGSFLTIVDQNEPEDWLWERHYRIAMHELLLDYQPRIKKSFESSTNFQILSDAHESIGIAENGYWLNAIGMMRVNKVSVPGVLSLKDAATAHFAFIKLNHPLQEGHSYYIKTPSGETLTINYIEKQLISRAIKVDQIGYVPDAGRKYAYLGLWMGDKGKLDLSAYSGRPFYLISSENGSTVFSGTITPRFPAGDPYHDSFTHTDGWTAPATGEDVYQMDFSSFTQPGNYYIYIPGIGRSWGFKLNGDSLGEAFYTHIRGLYHQRCGIDKEMPYTPWIMADNHKTTFVAGFESNDANYGARTDEFGFRNPDGSARAVDHFQVIKETATNTELTSVHGGWHDAADYDRRTYHFSAVQDLLAAYILFPQKFMDNQLNIPESGNGIPDIVDEATWGMELWRLAQNTDGGIGCWIETTSHPSNHNPGTDTQRYYLALPTIQSSMEYAAYASLLARVYADIFSHNPSLSLAQEKATQYLTSAQKAFDYATNTTNAVSYNWSFEGKSYSYKENPKSVKKSLTFKAALNLYALTRNPHLVTVMQANESGTNEGFYYDSYNMHWKTNPFSFIEVLWSKQDFPQYATAYESRLNSYSTTELTMQEKQPYRNFHFLPDTPKFSKDLQWGGSCTIRRGRVLIAAYAFALKAGNTALATTYRNAALLLNNWQNGGNPLGRTFTTGLGKVSVVDLLHHPSEADGIAEPIPGITIYGLVGQNAASARTMVNALRYESDPFMKYIGGDFTLLPNSLSGGNDHMTDLQIKNILDNTVPIWRRLTSVGIWEVAQNEFTIWETIAPAAAFTGCLMPDGWMPSQTLKDRQPVNDLRQLDGYLFQP